MLKSIDYLYAWQILHGEWMSVNTCEIIDEDGIILRSKSPSPDKLVIKHQGWEALSQEAKEVINTVLNSPSEIIDFLSTPTRKRRLNKNNTRNYFRKIWRSKFIADKTIEEVTEWVKQL